MGLCELVKKIAYLLELYLWLPLILLDVVTDVAFLVECYVYRALACVAYAAHPDDFEGQQKLRNVLLYGAWACVAAATIELVTVGCCWIHHKRRATIHRLFGLEQIDFNQMKSDGWWWLSLLDILGCCHDILQVAIAYLFSMYLGAGSTIAWLSIMCSGVFVMLRFCKASFIALNKLFDNEKCHWVGVTLLMVFGLVAYGGMWCLITLLLRPGIRQGIGVTYITHFNITVDITCLVDTQSTPIKYNMLFLENYEWRAQFNKKFQNATSGASIGPGNILTANFNVTGKAAYWQTTEFSFWNDLLIPPNSMGPVFLAMSAPIRQSSTVHSGAKRVNDRSQRFVTTLKMGRSELEIKIIDPLQVNMSSSSCSSYFEEHDLEESSFDECVYSSPDAMFSKGFPYDLSGKTLHISNTTVTTPALIFCPQPSPIITNTSYIMSGESAQIGVLVGLNVGLSTEGVYCRKVPSVIDYF